MKTIALAILLSAQRIEPSPPPPPPVLVVTGSAQAMASPDQATIRLGIVRQANMAQAAQDQASAAAQEIFNAIGRAGVKPEQIQTSRLVLFPIYAPRSPESREAPRIVAYSATNSVSVRLENLALVGPVIDAGLRAGANQLDGVRFGLKNDLPAREQALRQAVSEARSKAQAMADALKVSLLDVLEVSEGGVALMPVAEVMPMMAGRAMAAAADTLVSPGQMEIRANVTIRYRIGPKP